MSKVAPGQRFGRLTVLADTGRRKWGQVVWLCRCDCANNSEVEVVSRNLTVGRTRSCGCLLTEVLQARNRQKACRDLGREIVDLATAHGLRVNLPEEIIKWKTNLSVTCKKCGHQRSTNVFGFLKAPDACRHCSKWMTDAQLKAILRNRGMSLERIERGSDERGRSIAHCKCDVCGYKFRRTVGELASGNRGCRACSNVQEMYVRAILAHNFGGTFQIRVRPKWMESLELDGWNEEVAIQGRTIAFEYNGRYWHGGDFNDRLKAQKKRDLCSKNGVILFVVWALADRPTPDEHLAACQKAVDEAGIDKRLVQQPPPMLSELARAIPQKVRDQLIAINHEPIGYDQRAEYRGHIVSKCRLTGEIVSQAAYTLRRTRGCKYCQGHSSRSEGRRVNARRAAHAGWEQRRSGKSKRSHDKITARIVAYIRTRNFRSDAEMSDEVAKHFGVAFSQSGLQYARSGKTHGYLNGKYSPVRKSASNYRKDHAAVKRAIELRKGGLSLNKVTTVLFAEGYQTLKGTKFSAAQVKLFLRFA